jgi:hypothetical protein
MMSYDSYRLYQVERAKSSAEIRRAEEQLGRLAAVASSLFRRVTRPVRAVRGPYSSAARGVPRPAGLTGRAAGG